MTLLEIAEALAVYTVPYGPDCGYPSLVEAGLSERCALFVPWSEAAEAELLALGARVSHVEGGARCHISIAVAGAHVYTIAPATATDAIDQEIANAPACAADALGYELGGEGG